MKLIVYAEDFDGGSKDDDWDSGHSEKEVNGIDGNKKKK
jgi:hypothetical protein